jgi:hypothetical protein
MNNPNGIVNQNQNQFVGLGNIDMGNNDIVWNEPPDTCDNSEFEDSESSSETSTEETTSESTEGTRRRLTGFNMTTYEADVKRISRYLTLFGIFEKFDGRNYSAYDTNVNKNLFSWFGYENVIRINSHGQYELEFNLTDAVIQGTDESL